MQERCDITECPSGFNNISGQFVSVSALRKYNNTPPVTLSVCEPAQAELPYKLTRSAKKEHQLWYTIFFAIWK